MKNFFSIFSLKIICCIWFPPMYVLHIIRYLVYGFRKFRMDASYLGYVDRYEFVARAMNKYGLIAFGLWLWGFSYVTNTNPDGSNIFSSIYYICFLISILPLEYIFYPPGKSESWEVSNHYIKKYSNMKRKYKK